MIVLEDEVQAGKGYPVLEKDDQGDLNVMVFSRKEFQAHSIR